MKPEDKILQRIKFIVLQQEPEAKIYLYGSSAKGTAQLDSDWDLLILLKRDRITYETHMIDPNHNRACELSEAKHIKNNSFSIMCGLPSASPSGFIRP